MSKPPLARNLKQAKSDPDLWKVWKPAFDKQYQSLVDRKVFKLVNLPPGGKALPTKWVTDQRFDADGVFLRNRARLVICGNFEEDDSWSLQDVYAAVASATSVRVFLSLVATLDLECEQHNIITAFLHSKVLENYEVYCR
jgi:hypothetical protein